MLSSLFGDTFLQDQDGYWFLDTIERSLTPIFERREELQAALDTEEGQDRFLLGGLALAAERRGVLLAANEVYTLAPHPIVGGPFDPANIMAMDFVVALHARRPTARSGPLDAAGNRDLRVHHRPRRAVCGARTATPALAATLSSGRAGDNASRLTCMHDGQTARRTRTVTTRDIELFTEITGDRNPLHYDADVAGASRFGGLIVQGGVTSGLLNAVVAEDLPGPGSVFLHVDWSFRSPVRPGDTITAEVEVLEVREDKPIARLRTTITNQDGTVVLDGTALVYSDPTVSG